MQPAVRELCHVLRHLLCKIPGILNLRRVCWVWRAVWDIIGLSESSDGPKYLWWAWDGGVSCHYGAVLLFLIFGNSADKKLPSLISFISFPMNPGLNSRPAVPGTVTGNLPGLAPMSLTIV